MSPTERIADRFIISNPEHDLLGRGSMGEVSQPEADVQAVTVVAAIYLPLVLRGD